MKKLLGALGAIGLVASTGTTSVVSCSKPKSEKINIGNVEVAVDADGKAVGIDISAAISQAATKNTDGIKFMTDHPVDPNKIDSMVSEIEVIGSMNDETAAKSYDITSIKYEKVTYTSTDGNDYTIEYDFTLVAKTA